MMMEKTAMQIKAEGFDVLEKAHTGQKNRIIELENRVFRLRLALERLTAEVDEELEDETEHQVGRIRLMSAILEAKSVLSQSEK